MPKEPSYDIRTQLLKESESRVEVSVKGRCNLSCMFCNLFNDIPVIEEDGHFDELCAEIEALVARGVDEISWGVFHFEPTSFSRMPELAQRARELGIRTQHLISNGVRLADDDYVRTLAGAGIDTVSMTVYEYDERSADALAQSEGVLAAKLRAVENCARHGITMHSTFLMMRVNYQRLDQMVELYAPHYTSFRLGAIYPGMGPRTPWFLPPGTGLLRSAVEVAQRWDQKRFILLDMPLCFADRFEPLPGNLSLSPTRRGVYAKGCEGCARKDACPGFYPEYLDQYGEDEILSEQVIEKAIQLHEMELLCSQALEEPRLSGSSYGRTGARLVASFRRILEQGGADLLGELLVVEIEANHHERALLRLDCRGEEVNVLVGTEESTEEALHFEGGLAFMLPKGQVVTPRAESVVKRLAQVLAGGPGD